MSSISMHKLNLFTRWHASLFIQQQAFLPVDILLLWVDDEVVGVGEVKGHVAIHAMDPLSTQLDVVASERDSKIIF